MVNKVAVDLRFRVSKVRLLLSEKYFEIAATSAACFCMPLYNIVMPYLRHYSIFMPKIGGFGEKKGICSTREVSFLLCFPHECIFLKKVFVCRRLCRRFNNLFQVDCGLGDHFVTTISFLWTNCALSVAFMCYVASLYSFY